MRLLHLLSRVGQIPRGPPMSDSFSARSNENLHNNCVCCVGGLVSKKCFHPRMKFEGQGEGQRQEAVAVTARGRGEKERERERERESERERERERDRERERER